MTDITINDEYIKLGQALKLSGISDSGLDAKMLITDGDVKVNGDIETRRGRKLHDGDIFTCGSDDFRIISALKDKS